MLDFIDESLAGKQYLVGDYFSIADITALVTVDFARIIKVRIADNQKNLAAWHARVSTRPSAKA